MNFNPRSVDFGMIHRICFNNYMNRTLSVEYGFPSQTAIYPENFVCSREFCLPGDEMASVID